MKYLAKTGAVTGAFTGLIVALVRTVLATDHLMLKSPIKYVTGASWVILGHVAVGTVAGLLLAILIFILTVVARRNADDELARQFHTWLAILCGASVIAFAVAYGRGVAGQWLQLIGVVSLALGGWLLIRMATDELSFIDLSTIGAGLTIGGLVFLGASRLFIAQTSVRERLATSLLIYFAAVLVGFGMGYVGARLTRTLIHTFATRRSERASAYMLLGILGGVLVVLAATGLAMEASSGSKRAKPTTRSETNNTPTKPNVILISVDTLRADFPGYHGGPAKTPNLDALAEQSYTFMHAFSVAPWTRPSFGAFFSGAYPSEVGLGRVRDRDAPGTSVIPYRWRADRKMLPEVLRDNGYATLAVVTNFNLTHEARADQGFEYFYHCAHRREERSPVQVALTLAAPLLGHIIPTTRDLERARIVTTRATDAIALAQSRPTLMWFHYMDPHHPYDPPNVSDEQKVNLSETALRAVQAGRMFRSGPNRNKLVSAYIKEIEYCDTWLGKLIERLKSANTWDNAVVVFWSDHGEEFWEHGQFEHGQSLYNELLKVPLVIHLPGQAEGRQVEDYVSLLDVMPTVLELCGVEVSADLRGRSLVPVLSDKPGKLPPFKVYLESCGRGGIRKALLTNRYKLILDLYRDSFALYDIQKDPLEQHDIFASDAAPDTGPMERELRKWADESLSMMDEYAKQAGAMRMSPEVRKQLQDMGYIQ